MTSINRPRTSLSRPISWREVQMTADQRHAMERGTKAYVSDESKCSLFVSFTHQYGWHLSIAHPWRNPSWDEIASARYEFVPDEITMAMILPPEDEYINIHEHCFQLCECRCPR
jgi:hypothetical protein